MSEEDEREPEAVVPLWAERAVIGKREVDRGRVLVSTHVETHDETIRAELRRDDVEVVRVPVGRECDQAPVIRREGATLIVPIVEETLVITRRFLLKEEVRITATSRVETVEEVVRLRSMHAEVQRSSTEAEPDS